MSNAIKVMGLAATTRSPTDALCLIEWFRANLGETPSVNKQAHNLKFHVTVPVTLAPGQLKWVSSRDFDDLLDALKHLQAKVVALEPLIEGELKHA